MALFEIRADLTRTATALQRIADALERMSPPLPSERKVVPAPLEALTAVDNAAAYDWELEEARERLSGMTPEEREALRKELEHYRNA